jgi:hypothetical protein
MTWDPMKRASQYRTRATSAEFRAKKYKSMVSKSDTYKRLHDEALAEFQVLNRVLHGRGILNTPALLLAALQALRSAEPDGNVEPYDTAAFELARLREIDLLIRRIELEA